MPPSRLDAALPFVLRWEGGFVDHPDDPGGRTNQGVTQAVYDAWRARRSLPQRDVKSIEDDEVRSLYETDYWIPPRCPVLPPELDLAQFDTAVNMGVRRAVRLLQTALGCAVDGVFGDETEAQSDGVARRVNHCPLTVHKNVATGRGLDAEQKSVHGGRQGDGREAADREADDRHRGPFAEDHAQDLAPTRAERHTDAQLIRPLAHRERKDAGYADGRDCQRERREQPD